MGVTLEEVEGGVLMRSSTSDLGCMARVLAELGFPFVCAGRPSYESRSGVARRRPPPSRGVSGDGNNSADAKRLLLVGVQAVDLVVHGAEGRVELLVHLAEEGVVERDLIGDRLNGRLGVAQLL
jgi:hypothetical protein